MPEANGFSVALARRFAFAWRPVIGVRQAAPASVIVRTEGLRLLERVNRFVEIVLAQICVSQVRISIVARLQGDGVLQRGNSAIVLTEENVHSAQALQHSAVTGGAIGS